MIAAALLASIVRAARRRVFTCPVHLIARTSPETCELCILERVSAKAGRGVRFRSIKEIMQ